jgi:hypothetical protein
VYSPKIRQELIPPLYELALSKEITMTKLVNRIIEEYLKKTETDEGGTANEGKDEVGGFSEAQGTDLHGDDS